MILEFTKTLGMKETILKFKRFNLMGMKMRMGLKILF